MWYIVTPFKTKCLGEVLPPSVVKHAILHHNRMWWLNSAIVYWEEKAYTHNQINSINEFSKGDKPWLP